MKNDIIKSNIFWNVFNSFPDVYIENDVNLRPDEPTYSHFHSHGKTVAVANMPSNFVHVY
jgi:hypothetical protein